MFILKYNTFDCLQLILSCMRCVRLWNTNKQIQLCVRRSLAFSHSALTVWWPYWTIWFVFSSVRKCVGCIDQSTFSIGKNWNNYLFVAEKIRERCKTWWQNTLWRTNRFWIKRKKKFVRCWHHVAAVHRYVNSAAIMNHWWAIKFHLLRWASSHSHHFCKRWLIRFGFSHIHYHVVQRFFSYVPMTVHIFKNWYPVNEKQDHRRRHLEAVHNHSSRKGISEFLLPMSNSKSLCVIV